MDFLYIKVILLVNGIVADGSPVAMLQHATSSQSFVFHPSAGSTQSPPIPAPSTIDQYTNNQAKYEYKYEVSDHQTGDRKSHWESRDGDRVRGVYTLYEPDGALRTVEYSADAVHGFNAVVRRNEPTRHPHSLHDSAFKVSHNDGYNNVPPSHTDHMNDRNIFSGPRSSNEHSGYPPSNTRYNSGVGFSVNHLIKSGESSSTPY